MAWILQGSPTRFDIDSYLTTYPFVYWSAPRHHGEFSVGDRVFLWRAGDAAGVVAVGRIRELPTARSAVARPEALADDLWVPRAGRPGGDEGSQPTRGTSRRSTTLAPAPRPQQGRPAGWAPSSVREVLLRDRYRGHIVWNRTKKRNTWGAVQPSNRPEEDWIDAQMEHLRIVPEELWQAVQRQCESARATFAGFRWWTCTGTAPRRRREVSLGGARHVQPVWGEHRSPDPAARKATRGVLRVLRVSPEGQARV